MDPRSNVWGGLYSHGSGIVAKKGSPAPLDEFKCLDLLRPPGRPIVSSNGFLSQTHTQMAVTASGAVGGSVSCPRTLRHAEQGNLTSDLLLTRCWLYP